jgi:hypothetical protein
MTGMTALMAASARRLGLTGVVEVIRAITMRLLFRLASECLRLELAVLTAEVLVFLFQDGDAPYGIGMPALPIAGLLAQFEVLTPQAGYLGPQLDNFLAEFRDQFRQRRPAFDFQARFEEEVFHDPYLLPQTLP